MDKVVNIVKLHSEGTDYLFWSNKTPNERLEAIEFLRQQYMKYTNASQTMIKAGRIITKGYTSRS